MIRTRNRSGTASPGATIRSWPEVKAVICSHVFTDRLGCAYWVDTSQRSLEAFAAVGAQPHVN
jgi:hypothetical protein